MTTAEQEYKVIGTRPVRPDGLDKVTGRAEFGPDVRMQGMLFGRVKRSPHAHAHIKRIDASKALALDGVRAVVTAADFPEMEDAIAELGETISTFKWVRDNVLASDKALYRGHAVAAVCATDPHIAEDALEFDRGGVRAVAAGAERPRCDGRRARHSCTSRCAPTRCSPASLPAPSTARSRRTSPATSVSRRGTWKRGSPRPTSCSSESSRRR